MLSNLGAEQAAPQLHMYKVVKKDRLRAFLAQYPLNELIEMQDLISQEEFIEDGSLVDYPVQPADLTGAFDPNAVDEIFKMLQVLTMSWKCGHCRIARRDMAIIFCDGCHIWYHCMCTGTRGTGENAEGFTCRKCAV